MIKISYCITVYNEYEEIKRLIDFLTKYKKNQDEICILFDGKGPQEVLEYLQWAEVETELIQSKDFILDIGEFPNNFADWKNRVCNLATGDFIFNLDADEIPNQHLIENIHDILEFHPSVEAYWVPRINTLSGSFSEVNAYVKHERWRIDEYRRINFPDPQLRIFKRDERIKWEGKVHETVKGYKTVSRLPDEEEYALYHPKTLERQIKQNNLYNQL
jgi:hypothetical protein